MRRFGFSPRTHTSSAGPAAASGSILSGVDDPVGDQMCGVGEFFVGDAAAVIEGERNIDRGGGIAQRQAHRRALR